MSVYLVSQSGATFMTGNRTWFLLLHFADSFGWSKPGTLPPSDMPEDEARQWGGDYSVNYGQVVTLSDALDLAQALQRALAADWEGIDPKDAAVYRRKMTELVDFCRQGKFCIH